MAWCIEVISLCPSLCQWSLLFVWSFDLMIPGFARENALNACCGYGGKYNYNLLVLCGRTGAVVDPVTFETAIVNISESCPNPNEYIVWDGIHGTEAFYRIITTFFLTGRFVSGPPGFSNLVDTCGLDTSNFWQPAWGTLIKANQIKLSPLLHTSCEWYSAVNQPQYALDVRICAPDWFRILYFCHLASCDGCR